MNKINKKLLGKEKGFVWINRYSDNNNTDKKGRWSRVCYYNGFYIAWVNGSVYQEEIPNLENGRIGLVNKFYVNLNFPTSMQQFSGGEIFNTIKEAKKYTEEMFNDFKKLINETEPK